MESTPSPLSGNGAPWSARRGAWMSYRRFWTHKLSISQDPVKPVEKAPFFADANDRFNRNYVAEERARREEKLTAYENKLVKKANQAEMR